MGESKNSVWETTVVTTCCAVKTCGELFGEYNIPAILSERVCYIVRPSWSYTVKLPFSKCVQVESGKYIEHP